MALVLFLPRPLPAQTAVPASPPQFFPLEQVHRGLHGTAYTVFEGTQPEAMDVEILGVLRSAIGPGQDMILARLHGTKPEYTGVVAGMSGSPVYIDGKLLGALSYRIGEFSKEPIAGITPIGQMLQVRDTPKTPPPPSFAGLGTAAGSEPAGQTASPGSPVMQPIETPLVFNGFSPEAVKLWQERFAPQATPGLTPVAGIGGSSSSEAATASAGPQEPIRPGSAVSAILVRGDLEISATCTVTYVDPKQLLACGHPITQFGPVSIPMTKAEVIATLPSPLNAFKIVNTTETVGSFDQDRQSAIRGEFGVKARMIPLSIRLQSATSEQTLHLEVIDQPQITPGAVMVSVYQALMARNDYAAETSYHMRGSLDVEGYGPVRMNSVIAPGDQFPSALIAALTVGLRFTRLYDNDSRQSGIRSISLDFEAIPGRRELDIDAVRTASTTVHAGQTIQLDVTLHPYRGEARNLRIPVALPATLAPGPLRLLVSDGSTLDRLSQPPRLGGHPLDMSATVAQLNALHGNDSLYVTLLDPSAQAVLEGRTLASLPLSMANALEPLRSNQDLTLNGESLVPVTSIATDAQLNGDQILTLNVE